MLTCEECGVSNDTVQQQESLEDGGEYLTLCNKCYQDYWNEVTFDQSVKDGERENW